MTVRAVVFDFDGVIANSEPLHFRALRDVLAEAGIPLTEREYYARYLGFDDAGALAAIAADQQLNWTAPHIANLIQRKAVCLEVLERNQSVLFPGARTTIERLAVEGPLAIASGALREEIERVLERELLSKYFRAIVASGETPASKPAPDPYLKAVTLLSHVLDDRIAAADCVAVEDSRWGIESARAAGLRTVAVTHTYPAEELLLADAIVPALDAITWEYLRNLA